MLSQSELSFLSIIQWRWNWVDLRWGTLCEPGSTTTTLTRCYYGLWSRPEVRPKIIRPNCVFSPISWPSFILTPVVSIYWIFTPRVIVIYQSRHS